MEWMKVTSNNLPDFDVKVLIYWQLKKDKKEGNGYWDIIEIASVSSIRTGMGYKNIEWVDEDYTPKEPTHWMPLPSPPKS